MESNRDVEAYRSACALHADRQSQLRADERVTGLQCIQDRCLAYVLTYLHLDTLLLDALFFRRWKPTLVLDQAAQIFDLTGVARVAVDDAGEPEAMEVTHV